MNCAMLALLALGAGFAAWSAADVDMDPGRPLPVRAVTQPAPTPLQLEPHGCTVGPRDRIVLRAPRLDPTGMDPSAHARAERAVIEDWRRRMRAAGVLDDLLDRTLRMPNRVYELSSYEMDRLGCVVE